MHRRLHPANVRPLVVASNAIRLTGSPSDARAHGHDQTFSQTVLHSVQPAPADPSSGPRDMTGIRLALSVLASLAGMVSLTTAEVAQRMAGGAGTTGGPSKVVGIGGLASLVLVGPIHTAGRHQSQRGQNAN